MIKAKNFNKNTSYFVIIKSNPINNQPIFKKVTLNEYQFYKNYKTDYYKIVSRTKTIDEFNVVRVQLDTNESIYRDQHGNDVIKITNNDVLFKGESITPKLSVDPKTSARLELENNAEKVYENLISSLLIIIPSNVKHGFCSYISFEPSGIFRFDIANYSNYKLRIIVNGTEATLRELEFADACQYNMMVLCNGVNVELYIQEIQLLD